MKFVWKLLNKRGLSCTYLIRSDILQTPAVQAYISSLRQNALVSPNGHTQPAQSRSMYQYQHQYTYPQSAQPVYQYTYPQSVQPVYQYTYPQVVQPVYQYTYPQYYYVPAVSTYYR